MVEPRLRRSLLITPGNRPERLRKAAGYARIQAINAAYCQDLRDGEATGRDARAYRETLHRGHGTALVDGVFVAVDLVEPARRLLRVAALIEARTRPPERNPPP